MMLRFRWVILFLSPVILLACGSAPISSQAGIDGGGPPQTEIDENNYRIGPGDSLEIFVWRNPEISTSVPVRPDGKISMPLVEDIQAVGRTPSELAREIETILADYIRSPTVNVIVKTFVGTFAEQVRVVGQAADPKSLPFRNGLTLLDVMIEVGGLTEFAAGNRAKIVRSENGSKVEIRARLADLMDKGDLTENIAMMPGDVLIIPESIF